MKTTNQIEPLDVSNPITVLGDGETFCSFAGTMIAFPPADMDTDDIEGMLKDNGLDDFTFGEKNENWSLNDKCKLLQLILGDEVNISLDSEMQTIVLRF